MLHIDEHAASHFRVLVAEDDAYLQRILQDMLGIFGFHKVTMVNNGREAMDKLENYRSGFRYDFVIMDWEMPEMNGIEFLKELRQSELPDFTIPVLFCTSMTQKRHIVEARDLGVTEFLAKPFTVEQLAAKITSLLVTERNFVICDAFIGPCRRRQDVALPMNQADRRAAA